MFNLADLKKYKKTQVKAKTTEEKVIVDSVVEEKPIAKDTKKTEKEVTFDESKNNAAVFQDQQIASDAMALLREWVETEDDDLDDGEGLGDRLFALMVGLADDNKDGELSDDELEVMNVGGEAVYEYLVSKGISEENAQKLLSDFDNDVADNVREMLVAKLPEGDDKLEEEMEKVVFSAKDNQSILDDTDSAFLDSVAEEEGITLDAAYRKKFVIRNGKKKRINVRRSGKVRLSAKQKQAIRKAQRKANTGAAKMKRMKSFKMRKKLGL